MPSFKRHHSNIDIAPNDWPRILMAYTKANDKRSLRELMITLVPFICFWSVTALLMPDHKVLALIMAVPSAGFLVRLFVIQHDCGHRAFFTGRKTNDFLGRWLGVITLTPYTMWRRSHAEHHAISGNLDKRRTADIFTLTVAEYQGRNTVGKIGYRLYRNPITLFVIGPFFVFFLRYRLPINLKLATRADWISTFGTNMATLILVLGLGWFIGLKTVLLTHLIIGVMTATVGVWLFYVQHQFEATHWETEPDWDLQHSALYGASHYVLPPVLGWFTGNIGVHHVHHLSARVPFYRLPEVLRDYPVLNQVSRVGFRDSLGCLNLHLWDEEACKLVSFAKARTDIEGVHHVVAQA